MKIISAQLDDLRVATSESTKGQKTLLGSLKIKIADHDDHIGNSFDVVVEIPYDKSSSLQQTTSELLANAMTRLSLVNSQSLGDLESLLRENDFSFVS